MKSLYKKCFLMLGCAVLLMVAVLSLAILPASVPAAAEEAPTVEPASPESEAPPEEPAAAQTAMFSAEQDFDAGVEAEDPALTDGPEESQDETPEETDGLLSVRLKEAAPLYGRPAPGGALSTLAARRELRVEATEDPLWYRAEADGNEGYLYGENLYSAEGGAVSEISLFEAYFQEKTAELKELLPQDNYWNHMGTALPYGEESPWSVTDTPCRHYLEGESWCNFYNGKNYEMFNQAGMNQCLGFASLLSDQYFGTQAPIHEFYDLHLLRVGDHIRLREYTHSTLRP